MPNIRSLLTADKVTLTAVPEGGDGYILAEMLNEKGGFHDIIHIARNDARMDQLAQSIAFFAPEAEIHLLPAWDCQPYDRTSPNHHITSKRIDTLCRLALDKKHGRPAKKRMVITTVNAIVQRVPGWETLSQSILHGEVGGKISREELIDFLVKHGYTRSGTANEPGEFAVRGGIVDIVASGFEEGVRLDFFGDTLDNIRLFDPLTQISSKEIPSITIKPASEVPSHAEAIQLFRQNYRAAFGAVSGDDPLYEAISDGRKYPGMEHWLPLFYDKLDTLFDYLPGAVVTTDHLVTEARNERLDAIQDHYLARKTMDKVTDDNAPYHPVATNSLYIDSAEWETEFAKRQVMYFSPFNIPDSAVKDHGQIVESGYRPVKALASESAKLKTPVFDLLKEYVAEKRAAQRGANAKCIIACYSTGSRERLQHILGEHNIHTISVGAWKDASQVTGKTIGLATLPLEQGFETEQYIILSEQDLLGERIIRKPSRKKRSENFLSEAASLTHGELVVHKEHGIGRFEGLETLTVSGENHDCLRIIYDGGDKLFVPVENIELVTRYGGENEIARLDKLGGASWQARKARLKGRIKIAAEALLKVAAERALRTAPILTPLKGMYDEFCARFPYSETDDQLRAIEEVEADLASGKPMDRLVCGDVGFGKTEVALRAAFIAVGSEGEGAKGIQVAVVAPTTILCRQHYITFKKRFEGLPVRIRQLSRMVTTKEASETKKLIKDGQVDIIVGTHALLAKSIDFKNLGLLIVDEEQHFGVGQKERLKELRANVHVLTLSATPIPRTLQMSLTGIKELSLIATPPVDRLAVRTFVMPFDPVVIREAILREHYRGGRSFYVCPRIKDLEEVEKKLHALVPEVKIVSAHGQMPPQKLDDIMNAFYEGKFDILLSTTIVESGLDIPNANTIIIHRSDNFGLAQLYQLRGRVGRGKIRAYSYLTLPPKRIPSGDAVKRLEVMQKLDTLGAGFTLASHDMDIRGCGNLVGEEQSGHIKEVGIELYQEMLREAVANLKLEKTEEEVVEGWSPQINLGIAVLIPESYVTDLSLRLGLYRRVAGLETPEEIESFAAELIDRFGALPQEVSHLLAIIKIKQLCRKAGVEKVDTGPKGAVITFRNNRFANPDAIINFIEKNTKTVKLRADQKLVVMQEWHSPEQRLEGVGKALDNIVGLAA